MSSYSKYGIFSTPILREPRDLLDDPYQFLGNFEIGNVRLPVYRHSSHPGLFSISKSPPNYGLKTYAPLLNTLEEFHFLNVVYHRAAAFGKVPLPILIEDNGECLHMVPVIRIPHMRSADDSENLFLSSTDPNLDRQLRKSTYLYGRVKDQFVMSLNAVNVAVYHYSYHELEINFFNHPIGMGPFVETSFNE